MLRKGPATRTRSSLKVFISFVLFVTFCGHFAYGQNPQSQQRRANDYSIRGKIIIPNSREADQRIEVRLETGALQLIQTVYSDSAGNFEFRGLSSGAYIVSINVEG